jgi:MSHA biogenesis protein MshN
MSLINQVLQDLEKRHAADSGLKSLPPQVRAIRSGSPALVRVLAIALILLLAAVGAFVYRSGDRPVVVTPQATSKPLPDAARKQLSDPAPETQIGATPAAPPVPSAPVPVEPVIQAGLLPPVSRLSRELSLKPDAEPATQAAKRRPGTRTEKPRAAKSAATAQSPASAQDTATVAAANPPAASAVSAPVAPAAAAEGQNAIDKQMREMTAQQRAETAFRSGVAQVQEGRLSAAETYFLEALKEDPMHVAARQALLGLMLDGGRNGEAEQLLRRALELNPRQPRHAMVLARLEVDRGELGGAINSLVAALPYVRSDPEFHAFLAALLQRDGRHRDAVDYYRTALQSFPGNAVWLMGLGISLRASDQFADARDAFHRAADSKQLDAELQTFVERQLRELSPKK